MEQHSHKSHSKSRKIPGRGNGSSLVAFQNFLSTNKKPNFSFEEGVTVLTMDEVAKHKTLTDCWTVFKGVVYNIGPFVKYHPGGIDDIMKGAGRDSTELYLKYHPWVNADAVLGKLRLGKLVETPEATMIQAVPADESTRGTYAAVETADIIHVTTGNKAEHNSPKRVIPPTRYDPQPVDGTTSFDHEKQITVGISTGSLPESRNPFSYSHATAWFVGVFRVFNSARNKQ